MKRIGLILTVVIPLVALGVTFLVHRVDVRLTAGDAATFTHAEESAGAIDTQPSYRTEVIRLDDVIETLVARGKHDPRSWLALQSLAASYRQRAQLTGDYLDYTRAADAVARAFAIAPAGAGPFVVRAQLNSSLHRYDAIEADLEAAETDALLDQRTAATIASLRADIAFYRGDYAKAEQGYRRALATQVDYQRLFALANYHFSTGERAAADTMMCEAERIIPTVDIMGRAWLRLQRGVMDEACGRWDAAMHAYLDADTVMPGWWMVAARIAGLQALRGDHDSAITGYTVLIAQTSKPEFMDALASLYRTAGRNREAELLVRSARRRYDIMLQENPQAAYGHALDHFLTLEQEPTLMVELAERNRELRPGGEALTKLAQAYLQAGRLEDARATIAMVASSPWSSAESYALAARVYAACGEPALAQAEHARAVAIDPHR